MKETTKEIVQRLPFFTGLDDRLIAQVADEAILRHHDKDEAIVQQGKTGLGMYIVVSGKVRVVHEQAGASKELQALGPGEVFAEMSLLDSKPRSANVIAAEDSECLLLTRDSFVKLMKKNPEIPFRLACLLADRLRVANDKLASSPNPQPAAAQNAVAAGSAAAGVPVMAPLSGNGAGAKAGIQDSLLSFFENLYTVKAFTRFSVAVLGCPVEAVADNIREQRRVGEVKVVLLPADEPVDMRIVATESGHFTLNLFTPGSNKPRSWGPCPISPRDNVRLSALQESAALRSGGVPLGTVTI